MMKKSSADEIAASMAEALGIVKEAVMPGSWESFQKAFKDAGNDCAALQRLYNHWVQSGRLGDKSGQAMVAIRAKQRANKCPMM